MSLVVLLRTHRSWKDKIGRNLRQLVRRFNTQGKFSREGNAVRKCSLLAQEQRLSTANKDLFLSKKWTMEGSSSEVKKRAAESYCCFVMSKDLVNSEGEVKLVEDEPSGKDSVEVITGDPASDQTLFEPTELVTSVLNQEGNEEVTTPEHTAPVVAPCGSVTRDTSKKRKRHRESNESNKEDCDAQLLPESHAKQEDSESDAFGLVGLFDESKYLKKKPTRRTRKSAKNRDLEEPHSNNKTKTRTARKQKTEGNAKKSPRGRKEVTVDPDADVFGLVGLFDVGKHKAQEKAEARKNKQKYRKEKHKKSESERHSSGDEDSGKRPPRIAPNYFLSIRIWDTSIHDNLRRVQEQVITSEPNLKPSIVPIETLHLTLMVMHLDGQEEIEHAGRVLVDCAESLRPVFEGDTPLTLKLTGLGSFRGQVLFAKIAEESAALGILKEAARTIRECFEEKGIKSTDEREFNPHMTIMKLTKNAWKLRKKGIKKINPELYESFTEEHFGEQDVDGIELCSMLDKKTPDGYYYFTENVQFKVKRKQTATGENSNPKLLSDNIKMTDNPADRLSARTESGEEMKDLEDEGSGVDDTPEESLLEEESNDTVKVLTNEKPGLDGAAEKSLPARESGETVKDLRNEEPGLDDTPEELLPEAESVEKVKDVRDEELGHDGTPEKSLPGSESGSSVTEPDMITHSNEVNTSAEEISAEISSPEAESCDGVPGSSGRVSEELEKTYLRSKENPTENVCTDLLSSETADSGGKERDLSSGAD